MTTTVSVRPLDADVAAACASLTYPAYRHMLSLQPTQRHLQLAEVPSGNRRRFPIVGLLIILSARPRRLERFGKTAEGFQAIASLVEQKGLVRLP